MWISVISEKNDKLKFDPFKIDPLKIAPLKIDPLKFDPSTQSCSPSQSSSPWQSMLPSDLIPIQVSELGSSSKKTQSFNRII
jgi:hypothetical protein